jgi:hypothetical protein
MTPQASQNENLAVARTGDPEPLNALGASSSCSTITPAGLTMSKRHQPPFNHFRAMEQPRLYDQSCKMVKLPAVCLPTLNTGMFKQVRHQPATVHGHVGYIVALLYTVMVHAASHT